MVIGHCRQIITPTWNRSGIFLAGHGAVIVFFVLSGFVIAHTTSTKHNNLKNYLVSRYARLYSIYVPALIITITCAIFLVNTNPNLYTEYDRGNNIARYLITLFFCNELWFSSTAPSLNGPFWSLSFEFWYYTLFALLWFKSTTIKNLIIIIGLCLLIGPKILLMFPIWGLGWLAYKAKPLNFKSQNAKYLSLFFLILAFVSAVWLPEYPGQVGFKPLYMANGFLSDTITGIFVAVSVYFLPVNNQPIISESFLLKRIRYYANLTYPIYLLHFPLLVVCSSLLSKFQFGDTANYYLGLTVVLITSMLLGSFFENHKKIWYHFFENLILKRKLAFRSNKIQYTQTTID